MNIVQVSVLASFDVNKRRERLKFDILCQKVDAEVVLLCMLQKSYALSVLFKMCVLNN